MTYYLQGGRMRTTRRPPEPKLTGREVIDFALDFLTFLSFAGLLFLVSVAVMID